MAAHPWLNFEQLFGLGCLDPPCAAAAAAAPAAAAAVASCPFQSINASRHVAGCIRHGRDNRHAWMSDLAM
eukprot:1142153-Pelagomonas_calceolata.AAC.8